MDELGLAELRKKVQVQLDHPQRALVGQVHWEHLRIGLDRVAGKEVPPLQVLGTYHHCLLLTPVLQHSNMDRLMQLQHH